MLPRAPSPDFNQQNDQQQDVVEENSQQENYSENESSDDISQSFCSCTAAAPETHTSQDEEPTNIEQPSTSADSEIESSEFHCSSGERETSLRKRKEAFLQSARR